tara:strand:+ start:35 stop:259 length:225 start_codon:yes stop_codon:yes gene_type:complete
MNEMKLKILKERIGYIEDYLGPKLNWQDNLTLEDMRARNHDKVIWITDYLRILKRTYYKEISKNQKSNKQTISE